MSAEIKPTPPKPMSLYVIDDHPLMREAVVMLLRRLRPGASIVELDRIGGVDTDAFKHWAFGPSLRIMYVNSFARVGASA